MGYIEDNSYVRVDFFRTCDDGHAGKWYTTESIKWPTYWSLKIDHPDGMLIEDAFKKALVRHLRRENGDVRLAGMTAVCLKPYHEHAHPQATIVPSYSVY